MKMQYKIYHCTQNRFSNLILCLIGLLSILLFHVSVASTPQLMINCQFPASTEEEGVLSGTILIDVINTSGITLENILLSLSDPAQGFVYGDVRESFHLAPNSIQVISGSFRLDTQHLPDPNAIEWRLHYFDGTERDEIVYSDMCTS